MKHLYPQADVPVIQLSLDQIRDPQYHYELDRQLSALGGFVQLHPVSGYFIISLNILFY